MVSIIIRWSRAIFWHSKICSRIFPPTRISRPTVDAVYPKAHSSGEICGVWWALDWPGEVNDYLGESHSNTSVIRTAHQEDVVYFFHALCVTSQWPLWYLKSPASRLLAQTFVQVHMNENIKDPRFWPLWGNPSVTGGFPSQRASNAESVSIWLHHHDAPQEYAKYSITYAQGFVVICIAVFISSSKWTPVIHLQWNLYESTNTLCGLSRQVVSHDREDKHDFLKIVPNKNVEIFVFFSQTSPVLLNRFHLPRSYYRGSTLLCRISFMAASIGKGTIIRLTDIKLQIYATNQGTMNTHFLNCTEQS